ncbi:hypothetical protein YC2023_048190 [Brassica napus]
MNVERANPGDDIRYVNTTYQFNWNLQHFELFGIAIIKMDIEEKEILRKECCFFSCGDMRTLTLVKGLALQGLPLK